MKKAVQFFSDDALAQSRKMKLEDIVEFLESFRELQGGIQKGKSRLISIKIPEALLTAFRLKADQNGTPYQTQIKRLMMEWLR